MKNYVLFVGFISFLFTACSPKLTPFITMKKTPLSQTDPVVVLPESIEPSEGYDMLGVIEVENINFSRSVDSIMTVRRLKEEARLVGGNTLKINRGKKNVVSVLYYPESMINDSNSILSSLKYNEEIKMQDEQIFDNQYPKERKLPSFSLSINAGYGFRTAEISDGLSYDERQEVKDLMSGMILNMSAKYYFDDVLGIGAVYQSYNAKSNYDSPAKTEDRITFIGPAFLVRGGFSENKFIGSCNLGVGYIEYTSEKKYRSQYVKSSGASVGFWGEVGLDYRFHKNWGIGTSLMLMSGLLSEMTRDENGYKETIKLPKDTYEGLQNIGLTIGISYYIK